LSCQLLLLFQEPTGATLNIFIWSPPSVEAILSFQMQLKIREACALSQKQSRDLVEKSRTAIALEESCLRVQTSEYELKA
jgi:hypothetical protein